MDQEYIFQKLLAQLKARGYTGQYAQRVATLLSEAITTEKVNHNGAYALQSVAELSAVLLGFAHEEITNRIES
jgi:hypothetical protein